MDIFTQIHDSCMYKKVEIVRIMLFNSPMSSLIRV